MRCSQCGAENRETRKFCAQCGTPLAAKCARCGASNEPGEKFCGDCGSSLAAGAPNAGAEGARREKPQADIQFAVRVNDSADAALDGERKTVTALFADIKGSMELMEDLDPEEARAIVDPALKLMMDAVHHYDGYVVQSTGDGIFALFGAPIAHEDHPQRALYAALRLQEQLKRYSDALRGRGRLPLQARVGLNTGEVVVRSLKTGESHTEYIPIGHSTGLAARMQTLAPVGSIATTDATRKFGEGYFTFKPLGPTVVKGVSEPIEVYEVTGLGPLRTRLQRSAVRGFTKFVGREREMEALRHAADRAKAGRGQVVAAIAEPGVGKSRLFYEFKAVSQSEWMVLEAFSVSHGKATAYLPVLELLRDYCRIGADDDTRTRREKVTGRILALDRNLEDTLPHVFALLGLSEGDDPLAQIDPQVRRRRTHEAIKRVLLRESINQPLMVIFEDLHWIDGETQALLNALVDSIGTARMLLLVNYRPEYQHQWGSRTYYTQLRLDPLGRASAEEMLSSLLGDDPVLAALKRLIIERTEGNPFFMEETVQVLLEEGALVRNGGVKLTRPLGGLRIPPTVQAILAARIDRLPPAAKELLQTLAVIGTDLALELVKVVTNKSEDQLEPLLADLQVGEFIYEQPSLAGAEYTFKHALTQEVAYNSVLAERRRAIHDQTARAIERLYAQQVESHYTELAYHCIRGSDVAKALRYVQVAAEQAVGRAAYPEATGMLEAAVKLLDKQPEGVERLRAELELRSIESTVVFVLCGNTSPEFERLIRHMCELGEKIGEADQLLRGLIPLSMLYHNRGEPVRGLELARRCLELAEDTQNTGLLADARWAVGFLALACGNLREAVSNVEDGMRLLDRTSRRIASTRGILFKVGFPGGISQALHLLGRVDEAVKVSEEGLRHARESRNLFSLGFALLMRGGFLGQYRREPEVVRAHTEEAIELSKEYGFTSWLAMARIYHGWALIELEQPKQGVAEMQEGIASAASYGTPRLQYAIALLAQGYARTGRMEEALETLNGALAQIERKGEKICQAEMLRLKGEILLMRDGGAAEETERSFRAALEVARAQEARWWELRASTSLARLLRDTGRRDEARTTLAEIYNWFTEGFDTADLKEAKALLDQLNA
jgi:class 3 adenylate cyclase/tetratricopeptide (TPR) repeat protein